uniref:Uncharacterized protein n=1 Tax=Callorhinchus milii TaxID=7868 RepID=A0A4W3IXF8_CALMI
MPATDSQFNLKVNPGSDMHSTEKFNKGKLKVTNTKNSLPSTEARLQQLRHQKRTCSSQH